MVMDEEIIGNGSIGGKGSGFLMAKETLAGLTNGQLAKVRFPKTCFLTTECFDEYRKINGFENRYYTCAIVDEDVYDSLKEVFLSAKFPDNFAKSLKKLLKKVDYPLAVRSSSMLEDQQGTSFAGKYETFFISNRGTLDERLEQLIYAIKKVYASTYSPSAMEYRMKHHLKDSEEKMAILIQEAIGREYQGFFLPLLAGVGFSKNGYCWNKQIKKEDGLVRLVFGLGTRAVGRGYARIFSPGKPMSRPEGSHQKEIVKLSQQVVDALDLEKNELVSFRMRDILKSGTDCYPGAEKLVSLSDGSYLYSPVTNFWNTAHRPVLTFARLLRQANWGLHFPKLMEQLFTLLEETFECPVDVEFAVKRDDENGDAYFYLVQARPLSQREVMKAQPVPKDTPKEEQLFTLYRDVPSGKVEDIEYIIFIDPNEYMNWPMDKRYEVARIIGKVNRKLVGKKFMLMGPGRWGSKKADLGVPVRYSEISNSSILVEIAMQTGDYIPEVSYGTHFFQDLIEDGIIYLPVYPDEEKVTFNWDFFKKQSVLSKLLPHEYYRSYDHLVRVIHVSDVANGALAEAALDGDSEEGMIYLKRK